MLTTGDLDEGFIGIQCTICWNYVKIKLKWVRIILILGDGEWLEGRMKWASESAGLSLSWAGVFSLWKYPEQYAYNVYALYKYISIKSFQEVKTKDSAKNCPHKAQSSVMKVRQCFQPPGPAQGQALHSQWDVLQARGWAGVGGVSLLALNQKEHNHPTLLHASPLPS